MREEGGPWREGGHPLGVRALGNMHLTSVPDCWGLPAGRGWGSFNWVIACLLPGGLYMRQPGPESWLHLLLSERLRANHITSLSLSLLMCKMGMK